MENLLTKKEAKLLAKVYRKIADFSLNRAIKQQATETVNIINKETKEKMGTKEMILSYSSPQVQATFEGWLALLGKVLEEQGECN